jgi:large subunit ribosomal protein L4
MLSVPIFSCEGKSLGERDMTDDVLSKGKTSRHAIKTAVIGLLAHQRKGTASTKTRAEVTGSDKKPFKQKGTGRARAGSRLSPVWRGGGVTFGPKPHKYKYDVNHKVVELARDSALRIKLKEGKIVLIRDLKLEEAKTKQAAQIIKSLNLKGSALLVLHDSDKNVKLAFRNLSNVAMIRGCDLNAYAIMSHQNLIFTEEAFDRLPRKKEA